MAKFYTVKAASLILGYSTNTVYKLLKQGRLKASRGSAVQGRFRISHTALEDFLKAKLPDDPLANITITPPISTQTKKDLNPPPSTTYKTVRAPQASPFSPHLSRALIILGLIMILIDVFTTQNFSLLQQAIRLVIFGIIIVVTFQTGSFSSKSQL